MTDAEALAAFETLVLTQQPALTPWQPVTDYSFEARKEIEGRHPELIKEVFRPRSVVIAGCGTGFLDGQLRDGSIDVEGFDLHPPDGPHFWRQDLADERPPIAWDLPYACQGYDLVICREVLEHLPIRQIRQAVMNLCALSSRFVYVTTRFHLAPAHLLDVMTSDDLDPTHITMLNQTFLRVLFVLEGFKRRADLEQKMDHMKKGRVLVYERC